jgi:hypothetical protein
LGHSEDRFRALAAECLDLARKTTDQSARAMLLAMAQTWLELAYEKPWQSRFAVVLDDFNEHQMLDRAAICFADYKPPFPADHEVQQADDQGGPPQLSPADTKKLQEAMQEKAKAD